jgi:hypothetical protein
MAKMVKKAQNGAKTADSTDYFKGRAKDMARKSLYAEAKGDKKLSDVYMDAASKSSSDASRQANKGKKGYDKNGYPLKKKMKNGGSLSGLKASNKRVGPVDPKGAFTKVQKKALAGAKGKASLTKDKQLGATKMAKKGMKISKKK